MSLDWLIIGGGIHGVHIAAKLLGEAEVAPAQLRIVDPGDRLLERWRTCTATTGMTHLRSPSVHNLDLNPWSLLRYAGKRKTRKPGLFAPPYDRPHLGFFNDHCDKVIEDFDLSSKHVRARATHCTVDCDHVTVKLSTGEALMTRNVVLAIGAGEQPGGRRGLCGMIPESTTSLNKTSADGPTSWRRSWWWAEGSLPGRSRSDSSTRDMTFTWSRATRCRAPVRQRPGLARTQVYGRI